MTPERLQQLKEEGVRLNREVRKQVTGYILAGLGVVAGLAWNEAIKSLIEFFFPLSQTGMRAKFLYATLLTLAIVLVSMYVLRITRDDEKK